MPGLFFLDFVSLRALLVATWLKPPLKHFTMDLSRCSHIVSMQNLNFWLGFLPGNLSQPEAMRTCWSVSPLGPGICVRPCLSLPGKLGSWMRQGQRLAFYEFIQLFLTSSSYISYFPPPLLPHWCQLLGVALMSGSRMLVKTIPLALVWNFLEVSIC